MKFTHMVKHNGVYYPAGKEVPIEAKKSEGVKAPAPLVSGKVDEVKDDIPVITDEEIQRNSNLVWAEFDKKIRSRKYSDNDLRVSIQELRKLAKENGLKFTNKNKSDELREMLRAL